VGGLTDVGIGSRKARTLVAPLLLARPADQLGVLASRLRRILWWWTAPAAQYLVRPLV
jgi:hypothetical protein